MKEKTGRSGRKEVGRRGVEAKVIKKLRTLKIFLQTKTEKVMKFITYF